MAPGGRAVGDRGLYRRSGDAPRKHWLRPASPGDLRPHRPRLAAEHFRTEFRHPNRRQPANALSWEEFGVVARSVFAPAARAGGERQRPPPPSLDRAGGRSNQSTFVQAPAFLRRPADTGHFHYKRHSRVELRPVSVHLVSKSVYLGVHGLLLAFRDFQAVHDIFNLL
jgi:hypothetical protein